MVDAQYTSKLHHRAVVSFCCSATNANCFLLEQIKIIETPFMVNCFESTGPRAKTDISYTHIANIDSFDPIGIYS